VFYRTERPVALTTGHCQTDAYNTKQLILQRCGKPVGCTFSRLAVFALYHQNAVSQAISTVESRRRVFSVHVTAISQSQDRTSASTVPATRRLIPLVRTPAHSVKVPLTFFIWLTTTFYCCFPLRQGVESYNLSLKIGQGRASIVFKIRYWSVMSVNHYVGLSSIQWRASNSQGRPARRADTARQVLMYNKSNYFFIFTIHSIT